MEITQCHQHFGSGQWCCRAYQLNEAAAGFIMAAVLVVSVYFLTKWMVKA